MDSNIDMSFKLKRYPSDIIEYDGLLESTITALREATKLSNNFPKLIRTMKYEIPLRINNNNMEFLLLGLYISKENGDSFTREEWINILKENTPNSSKYLWELFELEECVMENGRFDHSLLDRKINNKN
jgi:hypothetical protein